MVKISNGKLTVEIEDCGAQISKIFMEDGREFLWQKNDPHWWGYSSPILFPIIGKLKDGKFSYKNQTYKMNGHGFARTSMFDIFEKGDDSATFVFKSSMETKKQYPFDFELYITYTIVDNSINFNWTVNNTSEEKMYFSIGGHPAFNINKMKKIKLSILPKEGKIVNRYYIKGPFLDEIKECDKYEYIITKESFESDALVFDNLQVLKLSQDDFEINLDMGNMPLVGIWSQIVDDEMAPFICIEPWAGVADRWEHNGKIEEKFLINALESGNCKEFNFSLNFKNK